MIGFEDLFVISALGLVLFGPEEFPTLARKTGRVIYEIKQQFMDIPNEINKVIPQDKQKNSD